MKTAVLSALSLLLVLSVSAQAQTSSRSTADDRPIKSLTDEEILSYLNGEGLGYAKAAELNRYPGPRHVLDLAAQLGLTEPQRQRVQRIYDTMHERAAQLGKEIVSHEAVLDSLFSSRIVDSAGLQAHVAEIARLQGELRATHLQAHLAVTRILGRDQILTYDRLLYDSMAAEGGGRGGARH